MSKTKIGIVGIRGLPANYGAFDQFVSQFVKYSNKNNSVVLNYDEKSENLFKWYQQLVGESLGKKSKGIIPIISSMPKDNHSLLQLYLDGPKKNFFTFFVTEFWSVLIDLIPGYMNEEISLHIRYFMKLHIME